MTSNTKILISQEGRDLALIFALANTAVNQTILHAIYAKTFGYSAEEAEAHLAETRKKTFADVCVILAKHGNLDVSTLLQSLGVNINET